MLGSTVDLAVTLLVRSAASSVLLSGGVVDVVVVCIVVSGTSEGLLNVFGCGVGEGVSGRDPVVGSTVDLAVTLLVHSAGSRVLLSGGVVDAVVACIVVSGTSEGTACEEEGKRRRGEEEKERRRGKVEKERRRRR